MRPRWKRGGATKGVARSRAERGHPIENSEEPPLTPKPAIDSHLGFAESFRVHEPISTSQFAAVAALPPRNNSLRYIRRPKRKTHHPCAPGAVLRPIPRSGEAAGACGCAILAHPGRTKPTLRCLVEGPLASQTPTQGNPKPDGLSLWE